MGGCNLTEQQFSDIMQRGNVMTYVARYVMIYRLRLYGYHMIPALAKRPDLTRFFLGKEQFIKFISACITQRNSCCTATEKVSKVFMAV
jgi:hypothetical protein